MCSVLDLDAPPWPAVGNDITDDERHLARGFLALAVHLRAVQLEKLDFEADEFLKLLAMCLVVDGSLIP